jgi:hypothetical protein
VVVPARLYERLQEHCYTSHCYTSSGDLPDALSIVLSTTSARVPLCVRQHEQLVLVVTPPGAPATSAAALRRSAGFSALRELPVEVTGIAPLRDRVGRFTTRAVCRVRL